MPRWSRRAGSRRVARWVAPGRALGRVTRAGDSAPTARVVEVRDVAAIG
jgi:hypothetical protein